MLRKSVAFFLLGICGLGLAAGAVETAPVSKKAGYALLDLYINAFQSMARTGGSGSTIAADIDRMLGEAKKARASGEIDAPFYARYHRLVSVTKLIITEPVSQAPVFVKAELERFIMDGLGEEMKGEGPGSIGQVAEALAYAVIDLQIYLDTLDNRKALYDKFVKGFSPEK